MSSGATAVNGKKGREKGEGRGEAAAFSPLTLPARRRGSHGAESLKIFRRSLSSLFKFLLEFRFPFSLLIATALSRGKINYVDCKN